MAYHEPVLLARSVELLSIRPDGFYADLTLGGGGHTRAILEQLGEKGRLFCFDRDEDAFANLPNDPRVTPIHANYAHLGRWLRYLEVGHLDGVLMDLGVCSHHFDEQARGFSYRLDAPLDMRMNQQGTSTAEEILATYSEEALAELFLRYGELRAAAKFARTIVSERATHPIATTSELVAVAQKAFGTAGSTPKLLGCIFQALRIEVNQELESLQRLLLQLPELVAPRGRVVVLAYHSLEDRLVKNFLRAGNFDGRLERDVYGNTQTPFRLLSKGTERAGDAEQEENSRSHSVRLRAAERTDFS